MRRLAIRSTIVGGAVCFVVGLAVYFSLAGLIDDRLYGERERSLPRVYARPIEIRRGQTFTQQDLIARLNDVGYAQRPDVAQPGEFASTPTRSPSRRVPAITRAARSRHVPGHPAERHDGYPRAASSRSRWTGAAAPTRRARPARPDGADDVGRAAETPPHADRQHSGAHAAGGARHRGPQLLLASRASTRCA